MIRRVKVIPRSARNEIIGRHDEGEDFRAA
jgi:hypothetical protein